ncbi:hypothetical protein DFS34DRAFT_649183 [Phlyctochytrium arcticum]|nr:hypothetical protein DFS34DRAFT_649183 [Phlyctochytrium arcticum]
MGKFVDTDGPTIQTVWFQFSNSKSEKLSRIIPIDVPDESSVDYLCDAIKNKIGETPPLKDVAAISLLVYSNKDELSLDEGKSLNDMEYYVDPRDEIITLENTITYPLLVIVPEPVQTVQATINDVTVLEVLSRIAAQQTLILEEQTHIRAQLSRIQDQLSH